MNLPNILTGSRFLLIGVFYYFFQVKGNYVAAMIVYALASVTDILDGYLARKWNQITAFGKLMDPLADKLLLLVALYCLASKQFLPWFIFFFILAKELIMIFAAMFLYKENVVVYSKWSGKLATILFSIAVIIMVLATTDFLSFLPLRTISMVIFWLAIAAAIVAFIQYVHDFWRKRDELKEDSNNKK